MRRNLLLFLTLLAFNTSFAQKAEFVATLSPAGSFTGTTSGVKGFAVKSGDAVVAKNILINMKGIKTGISLRDKHVQERLKTDQFKTAQLISAKGVNGKGQGKVKIMGIEKDISGEYEVKGSTLIATFPLKISEFGITGVRYMGVGVKDEIKVSVQIPIKTK